MGVRTRIVKSCGITIDDIVEFERRGFLWVRPYVVPWEKSLRNPTLGSLLELSDKPLTNAVPVGSCAAVQMYIKLA